jgi:hypothetical protein
LPIQVFFLYLCLFVSLESRRNWLLIWVIEFFRFVCAMKFHM